MKNNTETAGSRRLSAPLKNSFTGLRDAWEREEAFRIEAILFALSVPLAFLLGTSLAQTGLLIGSILLLMIVEVLNSAIEALVDRIGTEKHDLSRIAKDYGSAAVLLAALFPASVWGASVLSRLGLLSI